jgi:exopolysaccharide production protein ExoY
LSEPSSFVIIVPQRSILGLLAERVEISMNDSGAIYAASVPFEVLSDSPRLRVGRAASVVLNIGLSLIILMVLAPLLVIIALLVMITDPGPIFFAHTRIGRDGRSFPCLKFRTMVVDAELQLARLLERDPMARLEWERDHKLKSDPRITLIGNFLRRSSVDEIPQLFNVLMGQMALVGPRPIVAGEVHRYGRYFNDYCRVLPGITGLWQISGRSDTSYRRRVAIDVAYARSRSFKLDCRILLMTIPCVLMAKGSY